MPYSVPNYNQLNEWPLQFLRTGNYRRSYGYSIDSMTHGYWWSDMTGSNVYGYHLASWPDAIYVQNNYWRGYGYALREVARRFLRSPEQSQYHSSHHLGRRPYLVWNRVYVQQELNRLY